MPKPLERRHQYRAVLRAVTSEPWTMLPARFEAIRELLDLRAQGLRFTESELEQRIRVALPAAASALAAAPPTVAVIPVRGAIVPRATYMSRLSGATSLTQFGKRLQAAVADPQVATIVLAFDSPGGQVTGTPEAAQLIRAAGQTKRVIAHAAGLCCSGAYWLASAAAEIVAQPSAQVGSIGVLWVHSEYSQADAKAGVTHTVLRAGEHKATGNPYEPLSPQDRETIQARLERVYTLFLAEVAAGRGITAAEVRERYGEGRVFFGEEARAVGAVDRIATLDQLLAELGAAPAAPSPSAPATVIKTETVSQITAAPAAPHPVNGVRTMDPKLKAALVAAGLTAAEATDAEATAALGAFFVARGVAQPADVEAQIAALQSKPTVGAAQRAEIATAAAQVEATRQREIRAAGQTLAAHGLPLAAVEEAIDKGLSIADASQHFVQKLAEKSAPVATAAGGAQITAGAASRDVLAAAIEEVIFDRGLAQIGQGARRKEISPAAKDLRFKPLLALAEVSLQSLGVRTAGLPPVELARLALKCDHAGMMMAAGYGSMNTTGSLPNVFLNVQNKIKELAFQQAPVTFRDWCNQGSSVSDFKPASLIQVSGFGNLPQVPEGKEFQQTKLTDGREWYAVDKYGDKFGMTVEMIVGDDIDALSVVPSEKTMAAARTLNDLCYEVFLANPTMGDTFALFDDTNHGNDITAGGPPTVANISKVRTKLALMKGLDGKSRLRLPLGALLVPATLQTTAEQLVSSPTDPASINSNVPNPFRGTKVVAEPMLDSNSLVRWYGIADNRIVRTVVFVFLTGQETPQFEDWWDPDTDTRWVKIEQAFAAVVANWRGAVRNAGA